MRPPIWPVLCVCAAALGCNDSNNLAPAAHDMAGPAAAPDLAPAGTARPDAVDYLLLAAQPLLASAQRWGDFRQQTHHVAVQSGAQALPGATTPQQAIRAFLPRYC